MKKTVFLHLPLHRRGYERGKMVEWLTFTGQAFHTLIRGKAEV